MGKHSTIFVGLMVLLLSLTVVTSIATSVPTDALQVLAKKPFDLRGKVKRLAPPSAGESKPVGVPLGVEIVFPVDGSTLPQGTCKALVNAYAKDGIAKVEMKIDGPESTGWTEITPNFDGTYYFYNWAVGTDGTYDLTASVTNSKGRSRKDTITVYVGDPSPSKWAVVIGIADYEGRDSDLWHPDEDAKEMAQELKESGYPDENIRLLLNRKATAKAIIEAIDWLAASEKEGDEVVFFYSGHGYRASDSEGWDGDVESDGSDEMIVTYDFYGIPDGWFRAEFAAIESTKFALMFGSCHSGGMFDDNDDLQGTGRVIAAACNAEQYGWDYMLLGNTLWGYYFVDQGLLDGNARSVEEAHAYAYPYVVAEQPDSQPQLYDNFPGDFEL